MTNDDGIDLLCTTVIDHQRDCTDRIVAAIDRLTRAVLTFSLMHAAMMPGTLDTTIPAQEQLAALDKDGA